MLITLKQLRQASVLAADESVGSVNDVYFDDLTWAVRYFVVDTGSWLTGRKVLIGPAAVRSGPQPDAELRLNLTAEQIRNSPDISTERPISRQQETALFQYYDWPVYWNTYPPAVTAPVMNPAPVPAPAIPVTQPPEGDPNLRSMREVKGYSIRAVDGDIGHVEDFGIDLETRAVRLLVVDTRNWLPGRKVAIPPRWAEQIDWIGRTVTLSVDRQEVKSSPEIDELQEVV
jgi:uncharacterized protein YrrD